MADNLQNIQNLQRKVGQTWGQAFENVDKTSEAFHKLVDEFVDFVGDWKEFSDLQRDRMTDYVEGLGDVQGNWEKINQWVSDNTDTLDRYVGSLSDIRNLFQSIAGEVGGVRRQTLDNVNVVRNLARLASDNLAAVQQEGGLTENVVRALGRKSTKLQEEYRARLQLLGVDRDYTNILNVQKAEEDRLAAVRRELGVLEDLQTAGTRLNASERERLRSLREQFKFHTLNLELLDEENRKAVEGLDERIKKQTEYFRAQRRGGPDAGPNALGANRVTFASKVMSKFGLGEQAQDLTRSYGEWVTRRVVAKQGVDDAQLAVEARQKEHERAEKDRIEQQPEKIQTLQARRDRVADIQKTIQDLESQIEIQKGIQEKAEEAAKDSPLVGASVENYKKDQAKKAQEAANSITHLSNQLRGFKKDLIGAVDLEKEAARELDSINAKVKFTGSNLADAKKTLEDAKQNETNIFAKPFGLVTQIKEALGDIKGTLAAIAGILALAMWRQLLKFDEEAVKTKRVIGQWADASALANTKFVTGTEVLKTMRDLGEQFHINPVQVFSGEELGRITQAQKLTGMTAEAAGNLAVQSKITGKNADTYRDSIAKGANQANRLNHSAVNLSSVQNDVLNTSRAIALSYGNSTTALARAASTAASLGMNLQDVENISKNLMNFESSIEAEMQAQLLTGMQLNLAKAREYALNNDLEGVAREIGRQGMNAAKFGHMNYIQQENMAKALGMSREQMSKMLIMQEINRGLTAEQVAAMTGMRKEDIEALSAQEKWQTMKQRFLESLVPLLEPILQLTTDILIPVTRFVLGPITWLAGLISRIGNLVKENNVVVRGLVGILAIAIPAALLRGVGLVGGLGKAFKGLATLGVKIGKSIGGWTTGLVKAGKSAQATGAIFDKTANRWRDVKTGRFTKAPVAATKNVTKAATTVAPAAEGASKTGKIFSSLGNNVAKLALGAVAIGIMVAALWGFAKACQEFQKVDWVGGLLKASAALVLLGGIAALAGLVAPQILLGGIALGAAAAIFAGSIALLAGALRNLTKVSGEELTGTATGIRAVAGAVGELSGKLAGLEVRKLNALGRAFRKMKGAQLQIAAPVQQVETVEAQVTRNREETRESREIPRENISTATQEIVIKQAQVQASAQQISVEQKAADLTKIEQKIDRVIQSIMDSRPDWNWLEFNRAYNANM